MSWPGYASALAAAIHGAYLFTGKRRMLDEAVDLARWAVQASDPEQDHDLPRHRMNLSSALLERFDRAGEIADLDEAITEVRLAIAARGPHQTDTHSLQSTLGHALARRSTETANGEDLDDAVTALRLSVELPPDHGDRAPHLTNLAVCPAQPVRVPR
ncbi:hypothetical protein B0I31_10277 [Saccharothrix carnea]|uniref:Tetratricopeptide repeat protein n=1 Tax=Saccharothrix carnea TaxID=1280637 RepID=A0A2P8IF77_SACCR|nr:hypothetical protein [Saccharothrix carnea]PSL57100.1 hypothetical protein B0I31_10277 [Saccharothrix carnea]